MQAGDDKQSLSRRFLERFDIIVGDSPFAIFVNEHMTEIDLTGIILRKIALNKKYGIKQMNIHGIGSANVRLIQHGQTLEEVKLELIDVPAIDKQGNVLTVTVHF